MVNQHEVTDLIIMSQRGYEEDFNRLYNLTHKILYNAVFPIVNDSDLAYDLVHDTYLKILKTKMRSSENGLSYMITIAKNLALNLSKKRKREVLIDFEEEEPIYRSDFFQRNEETHILDIMHKFLKKNQIDLISMHVLQGLKHREIALKLDKPLGTVMWQYNEAIKELRKILLQ